MAAAHEILIVKGQDGVVAVEELGVENNLDTVAGVVE